jgi:hypothetical protein
MKNLILQKLQLLEVDWVSVLKGYLSGLLGALTVYAIMHYYDSKPYKIGTVNITSMVDQFVKQETNKNLTPEILKKEVSQFGKTLERELKIFSSKNQLVLFPNEAVIAGGQDYTPIVRDRMERKISHEEMPNVD